MNEALDSQHNCVALLLARVTTICGISLPFGLQIQEKTLKQIVQCEQLRSRQRRITFSNNVNLRRGGGLEWGFECAGEGERVACYSAKGAFRGSKD